MASITTPVTIVAQPYDTSGNGGRKLVRLSNGWLIAAVYGNNNVYFYKSGDNGSSWQQLGYVIWGATTPSIAIASSGTLVHAIMTGSGSNSVGYVRFDATTAGGNIPYTGSLDSQTTIGACSLAIAPDGTLHAAWTSKNPTYPNSFNIRYSKSTEDGQTWATPTQLTAFNTTADNVKSVCVVVRPDGNPVVVFEFNTSTTYYSIRSISYNGSSWGSQVYVYPTSNQQYQQSNPSAVVDNAGGIHVVWYGTDAADSSAYNIRYSKSTDGGTTWSTATKLTSGNTLQNTYPSLTVDRTNKLFVVFQRGNNNSTNSYNIALMSNGGEGWSGITQLTDYSGSQLDAVYPSTLLDKSLWFSEPPMIYKDQVLNAVKFRGTWTTNQNPTLTLTSPTDNLTLSEGNTLPVQGTAGDTDNGNVVTVKYKINNGPTRAIASGVSDGSSPISFARTLTYSNKRLWDGSTDVAGVDLAEGVDHTLTVWAEDDQGGKSAEVTRKFRVIWNRPPTISGTNEDLGTIMVPPSKTYMVTEPEGNPFTITEKINGNVIRSFEGVAGREETVTIPHDLWIRLDLDTPHSLTVEATDSQGLTSTRIFTFVRTETHIEFMLDFDNPDVEAHFTLDGMPKRVLVTLERYLPPGSQIEFVRVCNNALDEVPTWEDATAAVTAGRGYLFTNQEKTAENWRINIWVCIAKGTATERVRLDGYGGAFD
jgi:hypothetical protein